MKAHHRTFLALFCFLATVAGWASEPARQPSKQSSKSNALAGAWLLTMPRGFEYDATIEAAGEAGLYRLRCGASNLQGLYEVRGERVTLVKPHNEHLAGLAWDIQNTNALVLRVQPNQAQVGSDYRGATLGRQKKAEPRSGRSDKE